MSVTPFVIALSVAAMFSAVFAGLAWQKRAELGAIPLVAFHLAVGLGNGAYAADIVTTQLTVQTVWARLWLLAQALTVATWLFVAIEYTGRTRWATRRVAALLAINPIVFSIFLWVPQLQQLVIVFPKSGVAGSVVYNAQQQGTLLFAHFGYLFVVMLAGSFLFVRLFLRARHIYRVQAAAVAVAAIAPWTTVLAQSLGFAPNSDPSAIAWAIAGMALTVGLYRFETLDPVPAANESVVEDMGDGVVVLDDEDAIGHLNPAACQLLGVETDEAVGRPIAEVFPEWETLDLERSTDLDPESWQECRVTVDGEHRYLEAQVSAFFDYRDNFVGRLLVLRDVTGRKERTQTLARYKTVFETVQDKVFVLDADDRFIMANEPLTNMLGYDHDSLVGQPFDSIVADDPGDEDRTVFANGGQVEFTVETSDGETIPVETRTTDIEFEDIRGSVGYIRNISERRAVQRSLEQTSERLETLFEASPLAIVASDEAGKVDGWNPAAEEIFGYTAAEATGGTAPIIPEDKQDHIEEIFERVVAGERITGLEIALEHKDGSMIETSTNMAPQHDASGEVIGTVGILADITERKERERKLQQKNDRLEEFASVVSHDLRNPLQVAHARIDHVIETGDTDHAEDALDALEHMEDLIENVLSLARQGQDISDTEQVPLLAVVERAWDIVHAPDATLETDPLPTIDGDRDRLLELFENLFRNSVEHGGETVTITVGGLEDGFYVADDGPGIPADEREAVFETGFSTSDDGTGFGLAIVESIADAHGWIVAVTDSADGGARFEFHVAGPA